MFPPSSLALCSWPPISLFRPHLQSGYGLLMLAQWHAQLWKRLTRNSGPGNLNKTKDRQECRLFSILERPPPTPNKTLQSRNKEKKKNALLLWRLFHSLLEYFDIDFIVRQFNVIAPFYVPSCSHHLSAATAVFVLFCVCVPPYSIRPAAVSIYL